MLPQPGLKWVLNRCFEAEPTWTHDPKVETIIKLARQHLDFKNEDKCTADYYMQGAFNKIYLIRCPRGSSDEESFIFRISLPVDQGFKVASDVATMNFVRDRTDAPIPEVLAFDSSYENELGFAWTIMEMMPGRPLCEKWRYMSWARKAKLVKTMADIWAQLFRLQFRGIGNIYRRGETPPPQVADSNIPQISQCAVTELAKSSPASQYTSDEDNDSLVSEYSVGRIVSMSFLWHTRVQYEVYRGPFTSTFDWLTTRLAFVVAESEAIVSNACSDQEQKALAIKSSSIAKRVRLQLPNFFSETPAHPTEDDIEITALHHYDTSGYNVLVDEDGRLTAVLDWDGVSTVPLWKACQVPEFLTSTFIDNMGDDQPSQDDDPEWVASQVTKAEAIAREKEQLRGIFLAEVERMEPAWVEIYHNSVRSGDFEAAVHLCDSVFMSDLVAEWVHDLELGREYWSLQERLAEKN